MRDIINLIFFEEGRIDDPGCVLHDFVDPSTMSNSFASLGMRHDSASFVLLDLFIRVDANQKIDVRKRVLCLPELQCVAL